MRFIRLGRGFGVQFVEQLLEPGPTPRATTAQIRRDIVIRGLGGVCRVLGRVGRGGLGEDLLGELFSCPVRVA